MLFFNLLLSDITTVIYVDMSDYLQQLHESSANQVLALQGELDRAKQARIRAEKEYTETISSMKDVYNSQLEELRSQVEQSHTICVLLAY